MRNYYEMFILCLKMYDHFVLGFFYTKGLILKYMTMLD